MKTLAIVGATGLVGESFISILQKICPPFEYILFASPKSAGKTLKIHNKSYTVLSISKLNEVKYDYAVFFTDAEISRQYVPVAIANGAKVIDNSSCFRMDSDVPLVIDSVNGQLATTSLIANPNCTTIQLAIVVNALKSLRPNHLNVATYQAVSGAGRQAVEEWKYCCGYGSLNAMLHPIYDNVIPHIDCFLPDGYTKEEHKVMDETKKILDMPQLAITCTAVRVPVSIGHSIALNISFDEQFAVEQVVQLLKSDSLITVTDDTQHNVYPMPLTARGTPYVYVGRIRKDISRPNSLECFIVADNLLRGAAYNAYEILMRLYQND